jgi:hypothetical protein
VRERKTRQRPKARQEDLLCELPNPSSGLTGLLIVCEVVGWFWLDLPKYSSNQFKMAKSCYFGCEKDGARRHVKIAKQRPPATTTTTTDNRMMVTTARCSTTTER